MQHYSKVVIERANDKFDLLDTVADKSGFWEHIEQALTKSQKRRDEFLVAIKPNLMIFMSPDVPVVATDPKLVEHLVKRLVEKGFRNIVVVESQNTMSNWLRNRSVANVARVAGYIEKDYRIVDLTIEKVRHTYKVRGLPDWKNWVGRTWKEADYRIDFAKFKTQLDNFFTLCLKNQFGTLPLANMYWHYHTRIPYWACTFYTLMNFPVHFGFIDAYLASDGIAGFAIQFEPKLLKMMLAGENILALDIVGAKLMNVDVWEAPLPRFVMQHLGEPVYEIEGDSTPIADWGNIPDPIQNIVDVGQAVYLLSNVTALAGIINVDTNEFPPRFLLMRYYYKFMNEFFMWLYGRGLGRGNRKFVHQEIDKESNRHRQG